ncbi:hypothetical protein VHEMI04239 [[Torrubiella] hemipterigena]|uniref:Crh-like protein n=1 Tax=[Torrubiella] hemipterigena TaxID=1531966 RepID=A0A0A1TDQ6_9HYPO|nr:hypothetical protein VHEMI04239 [[Torrubiella] hemipterigena]
MAFKSLSTTAVAVIAMGASLASAQTSTSCDPTKTNCPADPALGTSVNCDFTKGACDAFSLVPGTQLTYGGQGAVFSISSTQAPTIESNKYIFFGRVDVQLQAAPEAGIVTSIVFESDCLDEIDWEFVGADTSNAQSNYFAKGNTATYNRMIKVPVANAMSTSHLYSVEWTSDAIKWFVDNKLVRTVTPADAAAGGNGFPQTPMRIRVGTWGAGLPTSPSGTRDWAGGLTDFSKAPFNAYYKSITITDYAGGNAAGNGGVKEYTYGDRSGTWQSILVDGKKATGGSSSGGNNNNTPPPASSSAVVVPSSSSAPPPASSSAAPPASSSTPPPASSSAVTSQTGAPSTIVTSTVAAPGNSSTTAPGTSPTNTPPPASGSTKLAVGGAFAAIAAGLVAQLLL